MPKRSLTNLGTCYALDISFILTTDIEIMVWIIRSHEIGYWLSTLTFVWNKNSQHNLFQHNYLQYTHPRGAMLNNM